MSPGLPETAVQSSGADEFLAFLNASPDPFHASRSLARCLEQAGSRLLDPADAWVVQPGELCHVRLGSRGLAAFRAGSAPLAACAGFVLAGAHTDSPCLRLRTPSASFHDQLMVTPAEEYGSLIRSSILDRPLRVSGEVRFSHRGILQSRLVDFASLQVSIPQLAIHLNREVNKGFEFNEHLHLRCISDALVPESGRTDPWAWLCVHELLQREPELQGLGVLDILHLDLYLSDAAPAAFLGRSGAGRLFHSGRLDNLAGCQAILQALLQARPAGRTQVALFLDHEEVGSRSVYGADSSQVERLLRRIWLASRGDQAGEEAYYRSLAGSLVLSVDAAHGWHPNFADRHDPATTPRLGQGVALKMNSRQRYATHPEVLALVRSRAARAGIPVQSYAVKADMPCGSTIGPALTALAGIPGLDLGLPLLAMHAARELASIDDQVACTALVRNLMEAES